MALRSRVFRGITNFDEWTELCTEIDGIIGMAKKDETASTIKLKGTKIEDIIDVRGNKGMAEIHIKDRFIVKIVIFKHDHRHPHMFAVRTTVLHHKRKPDHSAWCQYISPEQPKETIRAEQGWVYKCGCKPSDLYPDKPCFVGSIEENVYPAPQATYESDVQDSEKEDPNDKKQRLQVQLDKKEKKLYKLQAEEEKLNKRLQGAPHGTQGVTDAQEKLTENRQMQKDLIQKIGEAVEKTKKIELVYQEELRGARKAMDELDDKVKQLSEENKGLTQNIKDLRAENKKLRNEIDGTAPAQNSQRQKPSHAASTPQKSQRPQPSHPATTPQNSQRLQSLLATSTPQNSQRLQISRHTSAARNTKSPKPPYRNSTPERSPSVLPGPSAPAQLIPLSPPLQQAQSSRRAQTSTPSRRMQHSQATAASLPQQKTQSLMRNINGTPSTSKSMGYNIRLTPSRSSPEVMQSSPTPQPRQRKPVSHDNPRAPGVSGGQTQGTSRDNQTAILQPPRSLPFNVFSGRHEPVKFDKPAHVHQPVQDRDRNRRSASPRDWKDPYRARSPIVARPGDQSVARIRSSNNFGRQLKNEMHKKQNK